MICPQRLRGRVRALGIDCHLRYSELYRYEMKNYTRLNRVHSHRKDTEVDISELLSQ